MLDKFLKYIDLTKSNDKSLQSLDFDFVYGNGEKNLKTKSYIYNEYEFYYNDLVNKAAYVEQVVLDTIITDEDITNLLKENLIIFETKENYFLIFLSRSESKTFKLNKKNINFEQLQIIIEESLNETIDTIFYCLNYENFFELYIYNIKDNEEHIKVDKKIFENVVEANLLYSKSLQLRKQFHSYKDLTITISIILLFVLLNELYIKNKITNYVARQLAITKIKENKITKEKLIITRNLKKFTILEKKSKIQNIDITKIKDFKSNYKSEIKKLL